jgi:hypothetical protein
MNPAAVLALIRCPLPTLPRNLPSPFNVVHSRFLEKQNHCLAGQASCGGAAWTRAMVRSLLGDFHHAINLVEPG